ncbi:hypothetical protein OG762_12745 [Streptomyces sp. NBC_01136]|uniref:hypothetical protein n=1 Tax=unclassified Streptomyces TaxID=2593676 RepID=UPI00324A6576|nr:hypothetical protein OG762_12745 [Streptomyces sp. NBC_01136]
MSETSTMEPPATEAWEAGAQEAEGHGKHRGPVSGQDDEATPHGRHRKPSDQQNTSA